MTAFDSFPLGQPAFVTHILDRAAHLRTDNEKLFALENARDARAYVVYRDSLVVKQEAEGVRALLSIDEALKFGATGTAEPMLSPLRVPWIRAPQIHLGCEATRISGE